MFRLSVISLIVILSNVFVFNKFKVSLIILDNGVTIDDDLLKMAKENLEKFAK